jgi:hypothetical protein
MEDGAVSMNFEENLYREVLQTVLRFETSFQAIFSRRDNGKNKNKYMAGLHSKFLGKQVGF